MAESANAARHAIEPHTPLVDKSDQRFADVLGDELAQACQSHRCGHLVLVAPPRFLGMLHAAMDPPLRDRVSGELHHDFTAFPATGVRERVLHALLS